MTQHVSRTPRAAVFSTRECLSRLGGGAVVMRGGRCRETFRAGTPVRIAGRASSSPNIAKYVPGDDLRRLDWRAYGRSDRFYIKEFEADTNLRLLPGARYQRLDGFRLRMASPKSNTRADSPGPLADLAMQQGDAVGLSCVADGVVASIPPRRNPAHLVGGVRFAGANPAEGGYASWFPFCTSWARPFASGR